MPETFPQCIPVVIMSTKRDIWRICVCEIVVNMHACVHLLGPPLFMWLCPCVSCSFNQPLFLSSHIKQVNVYSLFQGWFMACYCCSSLILLNTADWDCLFRPPCHSVPCTVTAGPPWGPYIHSNWFGKDLAAFELKRDREESGEWGGEIEKKRKSKKKGRGGDSVCVDGCGQFFVLIQQQKHMQR